MCYLPISHLVAVSDIRLTVLESQHLFQVTKFILIASMHMSSNVCNSDIQKRKCEVPPLSEKVKVEERDKMADC
jgi:hypothetical protein